MKLRMFFAVVVPLMLAVQAPAKIAKPELHGRWKLVALHQDGHRLAPPNPLLHLFFEFTEPGLARLFYWREDETGFCERAAYYWFHEEDSVVSQRVVWLNPSNRPDCARDPDMRLHTQSWNRVDLVNGELFLRLRLGDRDLDYVFESVKGGG